MPSPAHEVASLFFRNDDEDDHSSTPGLPRTVSVRIAPERLARIDAMAEHAQVSRNVMVNELLRVGIGSVLGELPDEIREEVEASIFERLSDAGEI